MTDNVGLREAHGDDAFDAATRDGFDVVCQFIAFTPDHLMRLFEPAPGLLAVTGYNGRGVTTGSVVGKAFADYLCQGGAQALPMPVQPMRKVSVAGLRSGLYEAGFSLYHAGQCLRVVI